MLKCEFKLCGSHIRQKPINRDLDKYTNIGCLKLTEDGAKTYCYQYKKQLGIEEPESMVKKFIRVYTQDYCNGNNFQKDTVTMFKLIIDKMEE